MKRIVIVATTALLAACSDMGGAGGGNFAGTQESRDRPAPAVPDVLLNVPQLQVEELRLNVQDLRAVLALDARLANLLLLAAGVDVSVDQVRIGIKGVDAQARLEVRLHNVADIIDRVLLTLDRNPEILEQLMSTVNTTTGAVGNLASQSLGRGGLVDQTGRTIGNVASGLPLQ